MRARAASRTRGVCRLPCGFGFAVLLAVATAAGGAFPALAAPQASAYVGVTGELAGALVYQAVDGSSSQALGLVTGRLELRWEPGSTHWAVLSVEPWFPLDLAGDGAATSGSVAVAGAYAATRLWAADVYVGRFALPLETARLVVPYTLAPLDAAGRRPGVDGVRADVYTGPGKLQLAAVQSGGTWKALFGWRRALVGWDAFVNVLWQEQELVVGAGASGLAGPVVLYGEAWRVPGEPGLRYSVGATGYAGDLLWTAELARAPFPSGATSGAPGVPVPLVAVQVALVPAAEWRVAADVGVALEGGPGGHPPGAVQERAHYLGVSAAYELVPGEIDLEIAARRWGLPPGPAASSVSVGLRRYF